MRAATLTCLIVALTAPAAAQTPRAPQTPHPKPCFQGARGDLCTTFPLIEAGAYRPLNGQGELMVNYALGFMRNRGPASAVGFAAFGTIADEGIRGGFQVRGRRWLGPRTSFDAVLGIHAFGDVNVGSPMLQARLGWQELVAVSARVDILVMSQLNGSTCQPSGCIQHYATKRMPRIYLGAELGSQAGATAQGLSAVAMVVALIAMSSWDGPFGACCN